MSSTAMLEIDGLVAGYGATRVIQACRCRSAKVA